MVRTFGAVASSRLGGGGCSRSDPTHASNGQRPLSLRAYRAAILPSQEQKDCATVWSEWWSIPLGVVGGLLLFWVVVVVTFWLVRPDAAGISEAIRLLPDLLRLLKRLVADPTVPRGVKIRVALLFAYLALPFDLVPDFIPVVGYADDAIVVALVLRSVSRRAGPDVLAKHWPGTPDGLAALRRICRLREDA